MVTTAMPYVLPCHDPARSGRDGRARRVASVVAGGRASPALTPGASGLPVRETEGRRPRCPARTAPRVGRCGIERAKYLPPKRKATDQSTGNRGVRPNRRAWFRPQPASRSDRPQDSRRATRMADVRDSLDAMSVTVLRRLVPVWLLLSSLLVLPALLTPPGSAARARPLPSEAAS